MNRPTNRTYHEMVQLADEIGCEPAALLFVLRGYEAALIENSLAAAIEAAREAEDHGYANALEDVFTAFTAQVRGYLAGISDDA